MLYLFLNIFFIQIAILSSNHDQMTDQSLNNYKTGFYDENLLDNWIKSKKITDIHEIFLLKEVISKVGSLLSVLKTENCIELKKMIIGTKIDISEVGYPYYVLVNIIDSLKRIFIEFGTQNTANLKYDDENLNDFEKFLFFEFDSIYTSIKKTLVAFKLANNENMVMSSFLNLVLEENVQFTNLANSTKPLSETELYEMLKDTLESILPVEKGESMYVQASNNGFGFSRKYFGNKLFLFIREKFYMVCHDKMSRIKMKCSKNPILKGFVDMEDYFNKTYLYNKTTVKIMILLFHYYSEIENKNTIYEITLKESDLYQIKFSILDNPPYDEIKRHLLKQKITDLSSIAVKHKFGLIVENDIEYSTEKPENYNEPPIKTRIIILSCGHQLGFELINEFLKNIYTNYSEILKCYLCRIPVSIIGSYDSYTYRC